MEKSKQAISKELLTAKSVEEVIAIGKANALEITEEEAKALVDAFPKGTGALSDVELDEVAGGAVTICERVWIVSICGKIH